MYTSDKTNNSVAKVLYYNSDYPLYIMQHYFPSYNYYWQIEYDVFCNGKSYKTFFNKYRKSKADLIATDYRDYGDEPNWGWYWGTDWAYTQNEKHACFFPVVRMSAEAVRFLLKKRLEHKEIFDNNAENENLCWIYCECFVASELTINGFNCEGLQTEHLRFFPNYDLSSQRIFENPDNKLYHPVKPIENEKSMQVVGNKITLMEEV